MRRRFVGTFLSLVFVAGAAGAADPNNLAAWVDKVPPPPKTLQEALAKAKVTDRNNLRCALGVDEFVKTIDASEDALKQAREEADREVRHLEGEPQTPEEAAEYSAKAQVGIQQLSEVQGPYMELMTQYQAEVMAVMQDPKMPPEKKGDAMAKIEAKYKPKMEAMQARMDAATAGVDQKKEVDHDKGELPAVLQAREKLEAMNVAAGGEALNRLRDAHRLGHDALNETLKVKGAACYDPHVSSAGSDLVAEQAAWVRERDELRGQAVQADKLLAPLGYGAKAKTPKSRELLIEQRLEFLYRVRALAQQSDEVCIAAVTWSKVRDYVAAGGDECDQPSYFKLCGVESIGRDYSTIARNCQAKKKAR